MEKGQGKETDTLQTDNVLMHKEYIERKKVVELLNKWADGYSYIELPTKDAIVCVRAIPAADVVPVRHGRWKWEFADNGWANHICSECGYTKNTDIHVSVGYRYCPNCGALMDGGKDDV